jgi:hypothetical protein
VHEFDLAAERSASGIELLRCQDGAILNWLAVSLQRPRKVEEGADFDWLGGTGQAWYTKGRDDSGEPKSTDKLPPRQTGKRRRSRWYAAHNVPFYMALNTVGGFWEAVVLGGAGVGRTAWRVATRKHIKLPDQSTSDRKCPPWIMRVAPNRLP